MKNNIKFSIITLGCKVNSFESEALINYLSNKGWKYVIEDADVVIINTCTVTSMSDQKSRQAIRNARRTNKGAVVVAMGCYTQLHSDEASEIADIVIGTNDRLKVYELVNNFIYNKERINIVDDIFKVTCFEELKVNNLTTHTRGFIKIQDGCENYCSYCAIPYSRGKIRSRNPLFIIDEINALVESGTKEIIISGINTGAYGKDLENMNLAKLIEMIMKNTSIYRIRISSIELMEITDELLDTIKKYEDRIAKHFHIPAQAGCDSVLERMNRKYRTKEYIEVINKIRTMFDDVAITTDFLAGFVGETDEEYAQAQKFIQEIGYSNMHIFPYSRRAGTKADLMKGHLHPVVQKRRAQELSILAKKMKDEFEKKFIGKTVTVLVENIKKGYWRGYTSNYLDVYFESNDNLENKLVTVELTNYREGKLFGIRKGD